ncbi:MAG: MBL fold metallo-hydrolase [Bacteroidetes bacterium]|nr:MBL fold metallo-hydrolase [Bacteroidota bacterium]
MKVTLLGTGTSQGVPVIACDCVVCTSADARDKRLRTAALLQQDDTTVVIDAGPDFRQQMLRAQVKKIDAILITHEHKDHLAGLDDVRAFNFINKTTVKVYAHERVQEEIKREFRYAFDGNNYPGLPQIELHDLNSFVSIQIGSIRITPIEVLHHQLPVMGFVCDNFAYVTDANFIGQKAMDILKNKKHLVLNALRKEKHISHFNLAEALDVISILHPESAYLTHLSHQMGLHTDLENILPSGVLAAYDGMIIENA